MTRARLVLADGAVFEGEAFGADRETIGEVVFNTSHSGYQEILTDPSYGGQILVMTCPEIGNVGTNPDDEESEGPKIAGLVVRHLASPSNWRSREPLPAYLKRAGVVGLTGADTRRLVRHLRDRGAQMGVLSTGPGSTHDLVERAAGARSMEGLDLATGASCQAAYEWTEPTPPVLGGSPDRRTLDHYVVAIDYGLKRSMLRLLVDQGCRVTVVPSRTSSEEILRLRPDGVFLTNGPGDPAAVPGAARTVAGLLGKVPVFGICLGHQILALAVGGRTYKLKFGHRGANHPVKVLSSGRVEITSQNHGFAVDAESLPGKAEVTHVNLNDGTVEGLRVCGVRAFSVQYHPEASPGPHDSRHLFADFVKVMAE